MNAWSLFFTQLAPIWQLIPMIAVVAGAVFVVRNIKKTSLVQIQSDTIIAQQQQIDVLKERIDNLEFEAKATREALKDEGILITIDGERVTIKDEREPNITSRHVIKRPTKKIHIIKKTEEGN